MNNLAMVALLGIVLIASLIIGRVIAYRTHQVEPIQPKEAIEGNIKTVYWYEGHKSLWRTATTWYDKGVSVYELDARGCWVLQKSTISINHYPYLWQGGAPQIEEKVLYQKH